MPTTTTSKRPSRRISASKGVGLFRVSYPFAFPSPTNGHNSGVDKEGAVTHKERNSIVH